MAKLLNERRINRFVIAFYALLNPKTFAYHCVHEMPGYHHVLRGGRLGSTIPTIGLDRYPFDFLRPADNFPPRKFSYTGRRSAMVAGTMVAAAVNSQIAAK